MWSPGSTHTRTYMYPTEYIVESIVGIRHGARHGMEWVNRQGNGLVLGLGMANEMGMGMGNGRVYSLICNMAVTLHVYVLNALNDGQLFIKQAM